MNESFCWYGIMFSNLLLQYNKLLNSLKIWDDILNKVDIYGKKYVGVIPSTDV